MLPQNPNFSNIGSFLLKITIFFLALFLYSKFAGPVPISLNSTSTSDAFSVTGEGKASLKPTLASLRVGVNTQAATTQLAQSQMNAQINKVTEALKNAGIDPKDIQTENYNINPTYDYSSSAQKITGYLANTNIVIKIRDMNNANQIIDLAAQNGANQVNGLVFDNEDKSSAENEARQKAVEDAKKKAADAAKISGFKLGKLVNYAESFGGQPPILFAADRAEISGRGGGTQLEPGSNEVVINVTLSYEVK